MRTLRGEHQAATGRRLSAHIHAQRTGALLAACGRRLSSTLRWTRDANAVTCQSCRDALGLDGTREERMLREIFGEK